MPTALAPFTLSPAFLATYAERTPPFGFNGLGHLVFLRTYSRLKPDGVQEQWWETVKRVVEGTYTMQKQHITTQHLGWSERKAQRSAQEMYERMFAMKFLPPGRGLWAMGSSLTRERDLFAALNNPLRATEEVYTREYGLVSIGSLDGLTATFPTPKGWVEGTVAARGVQTVQRITFGPAMPLSRGDGWRLMRSNHRVSVVATPTHGWKLVDGTDTHALKAGDIVQALRNVDNIHDQSYVSGLRHGLIFGDGTREYTRQDGSHRFRVRLCGEKSQYSVFFLEKTYPESANGDPICRVESDRDLKAFPAGHLSESYLCGFLDGWLATDGSKAEHDTLKLSSQHPDAAAWLSKYAAVAGWLLIGQNTDAVSETNYGERQAPCVRFTLTQREDVAWEVIDIEVLEEQEPVYCPTIPGVGSFALPSGVHSLNCAFVSTKDLATDLAEPFTFLMDASMLGIGVGFDTKGAGAFTIHQPKTDFLVTHCYEIPDTREGWVESVKLLLESYFVADRPNLAFDYRAIRPAGAPIKGFGGVASGPRPLQLLHDEIRYCLNSCIGQPISVTNIVDIMNHIGACVVAGNVRRTAEIAFGEPDSEEFLDLKNYMVNPQRAGYGWTSNNSIFAEIGMDYTASAQRIKYNGEPGYAWLENMRDYSRMGDAPDYKDSRVMGANPCVEQSLETWELCCLVETFPHRHDSLEDYKRTLKFAYLYAKTVTLGKTPWEKTNRVLLRNRRIGLSQSGIQQAIAKLGIEQYRQWCEAGFKTVQHYDQVYSEWLAIPRSVKTTSIKPSGSVSLLAGATPGMHWPESRTYIRRMRLSRFSDLVAPLTAAGYTVEPAVDDEANTLVVEIPVKIEESIRTVADVSMWEQLAMAAFLQKYWSDNQVSATITFDPATEGDQIAHALTYYQYQLKGISFLPRLEYGAFAQMPYEAISEETYQRMTSELSPLNFANTTEKAESERFCDSSGCIV